MLVPCVVSLLMVGALQLYLSRTFIGRAIMAVSQDQLALQLMAADPIKIKRIAFGISIATAAIAGAFLIIIQPVEPSVGREYIGRVFAICVLGGLRQPARHGDRRDAARRGRKPHRDVLRPVMGAGGVVRLSAADAGVPAGRPAGTIADRAFASSSLISASLVGALFFAFARWLGNDYLFFAGYTVLQFIVLATAWNILGGYCGYVNFGSAAFFAVGAYSSVAMHKLAAGIDRYFPESLVGLAKLILPLNVPTLIILGGIMSGLIGLGTGYLTLRLRGAFFAIATLALAVVLQTLIVNWDFVGGSRGAYIIRPQRRADPAAATSSICSWSCSCCRWSRWRPRASSSSRGSATALPPSATTSLRRKPAACRRCG